MYCSVGSQDAYSGLKCSKLLIHKSKLTFFAAICILVLNFAIGFRMKALQTVYLFQADKIIRGEGRQLFITGRDRLHVYCLGLHMRRNPIPTQTVGGNALKAYLPCVPFM